MIILNRKPTADELKDAIRCDTNGDTLTLYYAGDDVPLLVSEPDPHPPISMIAFRQALSQIGLRQAAQDFINTASLEAQDQWFLRASVVWENALFQQAAEALIPDPAEREAQKEALWALALQIDAG